LLLGQHEHIIIGKISAEDWVAHTRWHLKQINSHFVQQANPIKAPVPAKGKIISAKGCDLQAVQAYYAALRGAPQPTVMETRWLAVGKCPNAPRPIRFAPPLGVPHPPPRVAPR
jgi:hypothetical protein